jgi:hypothetical protein
MSAFKTQASPVRIHWNGEESALKSLWVREIMTLEDDHVFKREKKKLTSLGISPDHGLPPSRPPRRYSALVFSPRN